MEINNTENKSTNFVLTKGYIFEVLLAIEELFEMSRSNSTEVILSGSASLFVQDFKLPRPPKDIDIVVGEIHRPTEYFKKVITFYIDPSSILYNSTIVIKNSEDYYNLKIVLKNGVTVDIISSVVEEDIIKYEIDSMIYNVSSYTSILNAKINYGLEDKNEESKLKHLTDVAYILRENKLL